MLKLTIYILIALGFGLYCLQSYGSDALTCYIAGLCIMWFAILDLMTSYTNKKD